MKDELMNKLDAELAHAGEQTVLSPAMLMLEQLRITADKELPPMDFLFTFKDMPCFPRRELVAVTGKAKSGKTFVASMLMACCMVQSVLAFRRKDAEPLRVLWYDTEQSDESTQDILRNRLVPMVCGDGDGTLVQAQTDVFNVRCVEWKNRRGLLGEAVRRCKPDLVVIDGIRDLVDDINDGVLAQEVMEELMQLATSGNCCIVCVLHQNKGGEDRNLRGWVGTELMNKAFEVYTCEKLMPQRIFKLEQTLTRKHDIEQPLYFEVGGNGLPVMTMAPISEAAGGRSGREGLPGFNSEYIISDDNTPEGWTFDVQRLFLDALHGKEEISGSELRKTVMRLSNIVYPHMYNRLLNKALEQKVVERATQGKRTVYRPAPF